MNRDEFFGITMLDGTHHKMPTWSTEYDFDFDREEYERAVLGKWVEPIDTSWMREENWDLGRLAA